VKFEECSSFFLGKGLTFGLKGTLLIAFGTDLLTAGYKGFGGGVKGIPGHTKLPLTSFFNMKHYPEIHTLSSFGFLG